MVSLTDLKELTLYKKQFHLPIDYKNKIKGSSIMLLTPNFNSSKLAMTAPYLVNHRYFESYYVEKEIMRFIKNESLINMEDKGEYIFEKALDSKSRNNLPSEEFGLPEKRKFPIHDKEHVLSAIRFFNHVDPEDEEELAGNIINKIKEFGMADEVHVGKNNRFKKYWDEVSSINEDGNVIVKTDTISYISDREEKDYVKFTGYTNDISDLKKKIIRKDDICRAFNRIKKPIPPKEVIVSVCDDPTMPVTFTANSFSIYTKKAYSTFDIKLRYEDYIKYIIQMFAIYKLAPNKYVDRITDSMAEPATTYFSGIFDKKLKKNDFATLAVFTVEKTFQYIEKTEGTIKLVKVIESNDVKYIAKAFSDIYGEYAKTDLFKLNEHSSLRLMKEEAELNTEIPIPESIKKLQNLGSTLKRKIRNASVYKMNKLTRDLERGNNGIENRVETSVEKLKNMGTEEDSSSSEDVSLESVSVNLLNNTKGIDYLTEGNLVYLFEEDSDNQDSKYDNLLKKSIYKDRFKNNKQVLKLYSEVKSELPFIKYTYTDINRYKGRNLFIDLSYYNESFFRNIGYNDGISSGKVRMFKAYSELLARLIKEYNIPEYTVKTIFIPVLDWSHNPSTRMWMYKEDINPISVIYDMMIKNPSYLKQLFGNREVVFLGAKNYFRVNFYTTNFSNKVNATKFLNLIKRIVKLGYESPADPDPENEDSDTSSKGIALDIINKVEQSQNVTITNVSRINSLNKPNTTEKLYGPIAVKKNITNNAISSTDITSTQTHKTIETKEGSKKVLSVETKEKTVDKAQNKADIGQADDKAVNTVSSEDQKDKIVDSIADAAEKSDSVNTALEKLDTDEFKEMITAVQNDSGDNVRVDSTQASNVIKAQDEFHKKKIEGRTVQEMLDSKTAENDIPSSDIPVASINEEWHDMTFMNFDKDYDFNADIMKMLDSMQYWTFPIAVQNIDIKDNSTSEDIVDLWTIECIDYKKRKFTLRVDIPKFINGSNFLKLRGNEKTLMIQSALLPIIKTSLSECQIIGSGGYNKIFVRRFGSRKGQSTATANRLLRALPKYCIDHKDIKLESGDNTKISAKYELPIDYIDISRVLNSIDANGLKIYFNQDELRSKYEVDDSKGIPIGTFIVQDGSKSKGTEHILYYGKNEASQFPTLSSFIVYEISRYSEAFYEFYSSIPNTNSKATYSKASILNAEIPTILICSYLEGLITTLNKAGIKYEFVQKINPSIRRDDTVDYIKFVDGYLLFDITYSSSLLMNGLKECDTESYSIRDVNSKKMYMDFLDRFVGSLGIDGLENSYDCMIDPITKEILERFNSPTDYVSVLIYASNLLADNKYIRHIDQTGRRWRRKELIAGYFYKALTNSYQTYANSNRRTRRESKMDMKQSAVIDLVVSKDPATSDLSVNNALNDVECANSVTNKGLVGMNTPRGYTIATRGYDESMLNLMGMDTGFSGNVGINRQATINANIEGGRGFVKSINGDTSKMGAASSFTMTEAVTPLGSTHDSPDRTLMTYVQTSKHMIRCDNNDPTLITTGADEAMPYLTSDIFAYKAKKDGKIIELVQEGFNKKNYMVVEYKDGTHEFINLSEEVKKNSDGGYYVPMKLSTDLKEGNTFKAGKILAYDKLSFSNSLGESGNLAATIGTLAKVAIINSDECYEDSAAITEDFGSKLGTQVIQGMETRLDKGSNIYVNKKIGDRVMEGETLFSYQTDFDDDAVNSLLKNLSIDSDEISELGRTPIKSKYTGTIEDIVIYRTCDDDSMSPSLTKFVKEYENKVKDIRKVYNKYNIDPSALPITGKVPPLGKTKNLEDAVLVIYYIKYNEGMSVGDKIVFYSANKGIVKYIIPKGKEPYTDFRSKEKIDSFMSLSSISGRMTCSIPLFAAVSKLMVELDRSIKDIANIPYDENKL